ncbi:MAG TPA: PQQ-binding-like beta-propeller repeat protein [Iamia sp.]
MSTPHLDPYGGDPDPYGAGLDPYGGDPDGGGGYGGPPPVGPPPPAGPPRRRAGPVVTLVAAGAVLVLVAAAAVVALTRSGADDGFGAGPVSEPEREWATDLGLDDDQPEVVLHSDGDVVYVVRQLPYGDEDGDEPGTELRAFDADDGEELWSTELATSGFDEPVRLLHGGRVLVSEGTGDGGTTRLIEARTGEEVWTADGEVSDVASGLIFGQLTPTVPDERLVLAATDPDDEPGPSVVVDLDTGEELWSEEGVDALDCGEVVLVVSDEEAAGEDSEPQDVEVSARHPDTGEEVWTIRGYPGLCADGVLAVATEIDELVLVELRTGDTAEPIDVGGDGDFTQAIPFGDHLLVSQLSFRDEEQSSRAAIFPRRGGEPTWDEEDVFAAPLDDDLVITSGFEDEDATLIRASDGEERGTTPLAIDDACGGFVSSGTILACSGGDSEVTSYAIDDGIEERWTVDTGGDVLHATVGGDRLFAVTGDGELVAFG